MEFLKILKIFILGNIFNSKEEYNPSSSKFNPVKVTVAVILITSFILNIFIFYRIYVVYKELDEVCPSFSSKVLKK